MFREQIAKTELEILHLVLRRKLTISELTFETRKSLSWISDCVNHLVSIGLIKVEKKGISRYVKISSNPLGESLSILMSESPHLNLNKILTKSGLIILPLLLEPGSDIKEISMKCNRSTRTVKDTLVLWGGMGITFQNKESGKYTFNQRKENLVQFVKQYSAFRNRCILRNDFPEAIIVWQYRDEFLFSMPRRINNPKYHSAASSRLEELEYDIFHVSHYYFYSHQLNNVSEEEALIQTIKVNLENPRSFRLLINAVDQKILSKEMIFHFARKYNVNKSIVMEESNE